MFTIITPCLWLLYALVNVNAKLTHVGFDRKERGGREAYHVVAELIDASSTAHCLTAAERSQRRAFITRQFRSADADACI